MNIFFKCAALALLCSMSCLIIKKYNPEMSLAVSIALVTAVVMLTVKALGSVREIIDAAELLTKSSRLEIGPVLKCVIIAAVTKITSELCRESAQGAAAASVEMAGTVCAMVISAPVVINMLKMIGNMV